MNKWLVFTACFYIVMPFMVCALDIQEIGTYVQGSNPQGIQWVNDNTLGMGSSFGYCFLDLTTKKLTTIFPDESVSCRFYDERDGFIVLQGTKNKESYFYDLEKNTFMPMSEAIQKWRKGEIRFANFQGCANAIERGTIIMNIKRSTARIEINDFDMIKKVQEYRIKNFDGLLVVHNYNTNEDSISNWKYNPEINKLDDYFGIQSMNLAGIYTDVVEFIINDMDVDAQEIIVNNQFFYYRVTVNNGEVSFHQIFDGAANASKVNNGIISNSLYLVILTPSTYLSVNEWTDSIILDENYYNPFCVYRDDGTILKQFDQYYLDASLPISVNWKRTRIAILCYDIKTKTSCVVAFAVIRDGCVNDSSVRLRSEPGLKGNVLGVLEKDAAVKVLDFSNDKETINNQSAYWYKVKTKEGNEGWVFGSFVDILD